jgi:hypothetical protein
MNHDWEARVQKLAKSMPYPPTPDIAAGRRRSQRRRGQRRLAQAVATLLVVAAALLAVPQIRAGVAALLRIGVVEVMVTTATPHARFSAGDLPESVLDFPGATTLDDARANAGYPIPLPPALGAPDRVYLIDAGSKITVLAWLAADGSVDESLHLLPPGTYALKMYEGDLENVQVNGRDAVWLSNPHYYMLQIARSRFAMRQVSTHALVWEARNGSMTYRLETRRPLDEAVRIAESVGNS